MKNTQKGRRDFLQKLAAGAAATITIPAWAGPHPELLQKATANPDEAYWQKVKEQFAVPSHLMMVNAANLCPSPVSINDQVNATLKELGKDVSFQFRSRFAEKRQKSLESLAVFLGVTKDEVGITRNTSESNNIVVNGLDLKPGDEVLLWDQNHYSNALSWDERAKRFGFTVKRFQAPSDPSGKEEILKIVENAMTSSTRVLAFSHISNTTGLVLPAEDLCRLARSRKVLTLVDGAQSFGFMNLNLQQMGCDFYSASTHKWLMGPLENGVLYVRKESLPLLWPQVISAGWKPQSMTTDEKLCVFGQRNETTPFALPETIAFHDSIGRANIEARVRALNARLREQIQSKVPGATFVSPSRPEMTGGITIVNINGKKAPDLYNNLYTQYGIAGAPSGGVRLSPHIYNTMSDMDKVVSALVKLSV